MSSARAALVTLVDSYEIALAGFSSLLEPHRDRVRVVVTADALAGRCELDVLLYEPVGLRHDQQHVVRRLAAQHGIPATVYSWRGGSETAAVFGAAHLSKRLPVQDLVGRLVSLCGQQAGTTPALSAADLRPGDGLTPREIEVLGLIAQGLSNQEICGRLFISINSLKTYVRAAYRKIGVERRSQAVLWAIAHGVDVVTEEVTG